MSSCDSCGSVFEDGQYAVKAVISRSGHVYTGTGWSQVKRRETETLWLCHDCA